MKFPERINKILPRVLKSFNFEARFKEIELLKSWPEIVGERIASHSKAISINEQTLFVVVDNPGWHAQLSLLKNKIIERFNERGAKIKDVRFILEKGG